MLVCVPTLCSLSQNYFEELVSVRDAQLAKIQSELVGVASDGERQRQELERVVLELQQQV